MIAVNRCRRSLPHRKILGSRVGCVQAVYVSRQPSAESTNSPLRTKKMAIKRESCDKWFSDVVRAKAGWCCEYCGKSFGGASAGLHCAHIFGRANKSTRWSLDNAVSLCAYHHDFFGKNPVSFADWLSGYYGEGHMDILREKRNQILKTNQQLRKEISDHYRAEYRKIEQDPDYQPISYN
jgi:hypothetical protein